MVFSSGGFDVVCAAADDDALRVDPRPVAACEVDLRPAPDWHRIVGSPGGKARKLELRSVPVTTLVEFVKRRTAA